MNVQESIQPEPRRSNSTSSSVKSGNFADAQDVNNLTTSTEQQAEVPHETRPPLDYSSFGAFWASVGARFRSIMTKRFIWALLVSFVFSRVVIVDLIKSFFGMFYRVANLSAFVLLVPLLRLQS